MEVKYLIQYESTAILIKSYVQRICDIKQLAKKFHNINWGFQSLHNITRAKMLKTWFMQKLQAYEAICYYQQVSEKQMDEQ